MTIIINWPIGTTEYLDIDIDALDELENGGVHDITTREWWPQEWWPNEEEAEFVYWQAKFQVSRTGHGYRIEVTYDTNIHDAPNVQDDPNIIRWINEDGNNWQLCHGTNTILVRRNRPNPPHTRGTCDWVVENPEGNAPNVRWRYIGRPRMRIAGERWEIEQTLRRDTLHCLGRRVRTHQ